MRKKTTRNPNQMDFLSALEGGTIEVPPEPSRKNINPNKIKIALSEAISRSHFDREEICRQVSELAGRNVSPAMLNAYTSQARTTHQLPSDLLAPLTIVLGPSVLQAIADCAGCHVAVRDEMKLARLGQHFLLHWQLQKQIEQDISELPLMARRAS